MRHEGSLFHDEELYRHPTGDTAQNVQTKNVYKQYYESNGGIILYRSYDEIVSENSSQKYATKYKGVVLPYSREG